MAVRFASSLLLLLAACLPPLSATAPAPRGRLTEHGGGGRCHLLDEFMPLRLQLHGIPQRAEVGDLARALQGELLPRFHLL
jgi:hypothetical protein